MPIFPVLVEASEVTYMSMFLTLSFYALLIPLISLGRLVFILRGLQELQVDYWQWEGQIIRDSCKKNPPTYSAVLFMILPVLNGCWTRKQVLGFHPSGHTNDNYKLQNLDLSNYEYEQEINLIKILSGRYFFYPTRLGGVKIINTFMYENNNKEMRKRK